jgi:hypothetical protein
LLQEFKGGFVSFIDFLFQAQDIIGGCVQFCLCGLMLVAAPLSEAQGRGQLADEVCLVRQVLLVFES